MEPKLAPPDEIPALKSRSVVYNANDGYRYAIYGRVLDGYSLLLGDPADPPNLRTLMSERHIAELLNDGRITVAEAAEVMWSNRNYAAETVLDGILAICEKAADDSRAKLACKILGQWDRRNDAGSRGALLFHSAWPRLKDIANLSAASRGSANPRRQQPVLTATPVALDVFKALSETMIELENLGLHGDERWGSILARKVLDGRVPLHGGAGDQGVLNVIEGHTLGPDGFADIVVGSSYMHVVTWDGDRLVAKALVAHGQSSEPSSPHYSDQLSAFLRKELPPTPFSDAEIDADCLRTMKLRGD